MDETLLHVVVVSLQQCDLVHGSSTMSIPHAEGSGGVSGIQDGVDFLLKRSRHLDGGSWCDGLAAVDRVCSDACFPQSERAQPNRNIASKHLPQLDGVGEGVYSSSRAHILKRHRAHRYYLAPVAVRVPFRRVPLYLPLRLCWAA